jgi:hypothetical protein
MRIRGCCELLPEPPPFSCSGDLRSSLDLPRGTDGPHQPSPAGAKGPGITARKLGDLAPDLRGPDRPSEPHVPMIARAGHTGAATCRGANRNPSGLVDPAPNVGADCETEHVLIEVDQEGTAREIPNKRKGPKQRTSKVSINQKAPTQLRATQRSASRNAISIAFCSARVGAAPWGHVGDLDGRLRKHEQVLHGIPKWT